MRRDKVLVYGYHGMLNFGDDLFVDAITNSPAVLGGGREPVFATVDYNWRTLAKAFRQPTRQGAAIRLALLAKGIARARTVAFVGGSTVSRLSGIQRLIVNVARLRLINLELIGVSVGPFRDASELQLGRFVVGLSRRVIVRDSPSAELVSSFGQACGMSGDLAALSSLRTKVEGHRTKQCPGSLIDLAVFPCASAGLSPNLLADRILEVVRSLGLSGGHRVAIVSLNSNEAVGDEFFCDALYESLRSIVPGVERLSYSSLGIDGMAQLFASVRMAVSMRLHGSISAYLSDVPFVNVSYHEKGDAFVSDVGLSVQRRLSTESKLEDWVRAGESLRMGGMGVSLGANSYVDQAVSAFSEDKRRYT